MAVALDRRRGLGLDLTLFEGIVGGCILLPELDAIGADRAVESGSSTLLRVMGRVSVSHVHELWLATEPK